MMLSVLSTAVSNLTIRPLRREELSLLSESVDELTMGQLNNRWREQEMGFRELFAAEMGGDVVGTVSIREVDSDPRMIHLFALEVANDRRNEGIGGALVEFVLDEARRRKCRRVYLEVRIDNPARRLYHRLGFRRTGRQFVNSWWSFDDHGGKERVEEPSFRMVRRVAAKF